MYFVVNKPKEFECMLAPIINNVLAPMYKMLHKNQNNDPLCVSDCLRINLVKLANFFLTKVYTQLSQLGLPMTTAVYHEFMTDSIEEEERNFVAYDDCIVYSLVDVVRAIQSVSPSQKLKSFLMKYLSMTSKDLDEVKLYVSKLVDPDGIKFTPPAKMALARCVLFIFDEVVSLLFSDYFSIRGWYATNCKNSAYTYTCLTRMFNSHQELKALFAGCKLMNVSASLTHDAHLFVSEI